jgi:Lrp/AsnC family transcriptional regulator, leucine-responsive regulatory protein
VDAVDREIVQALAEEARLTMAEVGRRVGLSRTAALARVRRLEESGVVTGYHAAVRWPEDPGRHVARVGIRTDTRDTGRYVRRLAALDGFREAETTSGDFDLLVRLETPTAEALDALLDEIKSWPTTTRTTTFVVLRRYGPDPGGMDGPTGRPGG